LKPRRFHAFWSVDGSPSPSASGRNRSRGTPRLRVFIRDRDCSRLDSRGLASPPCVATAGSAKLLSWGFPKIASPPVSAPHVRTVFSDSHGWLPTPGAKMPLSARAPSLPFHPASTVSSVRPLAGLLRPATGPEVRPVSDRFLSVIAATHCCAVRLKLAILLKSAFHTLQSLPLAVRRTASPRPLPSCRSDRLQGVSRATNPLSWTGVTTSHNPMLSWASFPFRVLPSRSARFKFRFKRD